MSTTPVTTAPARSPHPAVMSQAQTRAGELQYVSAFRIVPSTTNPRKTRNPQSDAELLESIRLTPVFQSLLLRPVTAEPEHVQRFEGWFKSTTKAKAQFKPGEPILEIVAGERRWEMTIRAGRTEVPAVVREMGQAEAMKLQIIENLQRDDIDAIDEAFGFQQLIKQGMSAAEISREIGKVGKSDRYVQQAAQRVNVIPELINLYRKSEISVSHIDLLSGIPKEAQKTALRKPNVTTGLFTWDGRTRSVRELRDWIRQSVHLSLDAAPFRKDDPNLVREAGACTSCDKNTAVNPVLDPDAKHPTCTDQPCYEKKQQAHLVQIQSAIKSTGKEVLRVSGILGKRPTKNDEFVPVGDWMEVKKNSCKSATEAIQIDGPQMGRKLTVCANKSCSVHRPKDYSRMSTRPRTSKPATYKPSAAELRSAAKLKADQEKIRHKISINNAVNVATLSAIAGKAKIDRWLLNGIAALLVETNDWDDPWVDQFLQHLNFVKPKNGEKYGYKELAKAAKNLIPKMSESQLVSFVAALIAGGWHYTLPLDIKDFAAHYKVDAGKIRGQVVKQFKAAEKKPTATPNPKRLKAAKKQAAKRKLASSKPKAKAKARK